MITDIFDTIINKTSSIDEAMSSFENLMEENKDMKELYNDWCLDIGFKPKNGFKEYYSEYISLKEIDIHSMFDNDEEFYDYLVYNL